ncbi:MAG: hypothetical protein O2861_15165 [Proteobacteria bacterium]|nr:hypothetical protein [Pseudomonadota bacterium]
MKGCAKREVGNEFANSQNRPQDDCERIVTVGWRIAVSGSSVFE